jgi:hypothetical protein
MNTVQSPFQPIIAQVKTTNEAAELLLHIDTILARIYTLESQPFEKIAYASLDPQIAKVIHETFASFRLSWSHSEEVKNFFSNLKDAIRRCAVITITLAYKPSSESITALSLWTRTNIDANTLLEINLDHDLIGGAIVVYKGNYLDLSVKKSLNDYFQKHKSEILKELI